MLEEKKAKHYIGYIRETIGEFQTSHKYLFATDGDPQAYVDRVAKTFRGDDATGKDGDYLTCGGQVRIQAYPANEVPPEDFAVLNRYLGSL